MQQWAQEGRLPTDRIITMKDLRDSNCVGRKMGWGVKVLGRGARRLATPLHLEVGGRLGCAGGGGPSGALGCWFVIVGWFVVCEMGRLVGRRGCHVLCRHQGADAASLRLVWCSFVLCACPTPPLPAARLRSKLLDRVSSECTASA